MMMMMMMMMMMISDDDDDDDDCERVVEQWDRQGRMRMILKDQV
jgi:hypothetical protein